jgi:hypothetical protein
MKMLHVCASLAAAAIVFETASASAFTLANPDFTSPAPGFPAGGPVTTLAVCVGDAVGQSASASWTTFANTVQTDVNSWLLTGPEGLSSNLVAVGGREDGLVQVLPGTGLHDMTDVNHVDAWVYVVAGRVGVQLGDGGCGGGESGVSMSTGTWEYIHACARPDRRNNEVTLYGAGPAVFYVHKASVSYDPACPFCAHDRATAGAPLSPDCGVCEATVCAPSVDPYCCTTAWDPICVSEAAAMCSPC